MRLIKTMVMAGVARLGPAEVLTPLEMASRPVSDDPPWRRRAAATNRPAP